VLQRRERAAEPVAITQRARKRRDRYVTGFFFGFGTGFVGATGFAFVFDTDLAATTGFVCVFDTDLSRNNGFRFCFRYRLCREYSLRVSYGLGRYRLCRHGTFCFSCALCWHNRLYCHRLSVDIQSLEMWRFNRRSWSFPEPTSLNVLSSSSNSVSFAPGHEHHAQAPAASPGICDAGFLGRDRLGAKSHRALHAVTVARPSASRVAVC
jgi:hypothetical protein